MPPLPELVEHRFDFSGGRNTATSPDMLNPNELVNLTNARLDVLRAFLKRTGSKRMHTTAIGGGAPVRGLTQWDSPSGRQIVAISNGRLYHKLTDFGEFTEVIPPVGDEFSTTRATHFYTFRAKASGAPLLLFAASGGKYYKWTGSVLTRITTAGTPSSLILSPYLTRMFVVDANFLKHLFWSRVGDAESFATGLSTDGGSAMVDVLTGDEILAIDQIGSSLALMTEDAIASFRGLDSDNIVISQGLSGISPEIGIVGESAEARIETVLAIVSDRGAYLVQETGPRAIGVDVEPDFDAMDRANVSKAVVGHHRQRREAWFAMPGISDAGLNKTVFVYNYRIQNWCGPFTYPFGILALSRFEDSLGAEWLISGGSDGFVRHMDIGGKDDVLADGSGGSIYTMTAQPAPIFFETGPGKVKALTRLDLQADLPASSALQIQARFDNDAFTALAPSTIVGIGGGTQPYRLDADQQGKRLDLRFIDVSADIPIINGFSAKASDYGERF